MSNDEGASSTKRTNPEGNGHIVKTVANSNNATAGTPTHLQETYTDSPKGAGLKKKKLPPGGGGMKVRRRLSVVGGAKMDGITHKMSGLGDENAASAAQQATAMTNATNALGGGGIGGCYHLSAELSKKGYAPYNPGKVNQDSVVNFEQEGFTFYGALDGHGEFGHKVSQYLVKEFEASMRACIAKGAFTTGPGEVAKRMSEQLLSDEAFLNSQRCSINTEFSGTTLTIGCLYKVDGQEHLTAVNAGDSRLIFGTVDAANNVGTMEVTIDHKPDLPSEMARITAVDPATGKPKGRVYKLNYPGVDPATIPARVWLYNEDIPGLAMSRSLGDMCAHRAGVSSTPEVFEVDVPGTVRYLCVASDGLWEFMSNEEVLDIIHKNVKVVPNPTSVDIQQVMLPSMQAANDRLKEISSELWMQEEQVVDDTSMVIALFNLPTM